MDWSDRIADVLSTPEISFSRSFYGAGSLSDSPVVITVSRVSGAEYERLAGGDTDCRLVILDAAAD